MTDLFFRAMTRYQMMMMTTTTRSKQLRVLHGRELYGDDGESMRSTGRNANF